jgi:hypothetical protein
MKAVKEFFEKIDLTKKHPDYFRRGIFRVAIYFYLILTIVVLTQNGFDLNKVSLSCPNNSRGTCINPAYDNIEYSTLCKRYPVLCEKQFLEVGEVIETETKGIFDYYGFLAVGSLVGAFGLNHLLYLRRKYKK